MENISSNAERALPRTLRHQRELVMDDEKQIDITRELISTARALEYSAQPDIHVRAINNILLQEPIPSDLLGVIEPEIQPATYTYAEHSDGTARATLSIDTSNQEKLSFILTSSNEKRLNDWSVTTTLAGELQPMSHGAVLNYLLERIPTAVFNRAIIDHPSVNDEDMMTYLFENFSNIPGARVTDALYYNASDCLLSNDNDIDYIGESRVTIGVVRHPEAIEYTCRTNQESDTIRNLLVYKDDKELVDVNIGRIRQDYIIKVNIPDDTSKDIIHSGTISLQSSSCTSGKLHRFAQEQTLSSRPYEHLINAISLTHSQHLR